MEGWDTSLVVWIGTFNGMEVADRKSVMRFLRMISEWIEEERDDLLEEERDDLLIDDDELFDTDKDDD